LFVRGSPEARKRGLFLLQYHSDAQTDLAFRRLPLPWVSFVVTLTDPGHWRLPDGEWRAFPRIALRGAATTWTEGYETASSRAEYLVALLEPWAIKPIFGVPAAHLHNQVVDLESLWGAEAQSLYDRIASARSGYAKIALLEEAVLRTVSHREVDRLVQAYVNICRRSAGAVRLQDVTSALDCSRRQFRTSFQRELGVMPKRWALLERFAARARELHPSSWGAKDELIGTNYTDQAHEIHEFVRHAGVTPGQYRRQKMEGDPRIFIIPSSL
jgi:AraC-like DNA-binding protein